MQFGFRIFRALVFCSVALFLSGEASSGTVSFIKVTVDRPGNSADTTGFGAVPYIYEISQTEVTNADYAQFLNAVAASDDAYGLYNTAMASGHGGITRESLLLGGFHYTPISGRENMPVNSVSFYDCLRFVNWLENGQPTGVQANTTTEDGAYTFSGPTTVGGRNPGASYYLPTEDEWYKAAYYDPSLQVYFDYPTGSNTAPTCAAPGAATANTANCDSAAAGDLTGVGQYINSPSPVGTFDQGGNVWEWNEAVIGGNRGARGGGFASAVSFLAASNQSSFAPTSEFVNTGFRVVANVPEPGQGLLWTVALLTVACLQRVRS